MELNGPKQILGNALFFGLFLSLPIAGLFRLDFQLFLEEVIANPFVAGGIGLAVLYLVLFTTPGRSTGAPHSSPPPE